MVHSRRWQTSERNGHIGTPPDVYALPRVNVLVIDDDEDMREMLADYIRNAGYSAVTASDGREAIARLHEVRPELILLDVVMPGMDGACFREQQRRNPHWISIPTIVMTGKSDEPVLDVAIEDVLRKPANAKRILELVAAHCLK